MRTLSFLILLSFFALGFGAAADEPKVLPKVESDTASEFDWESQTPLDLLEFLRTTSLFTVAEARRGWVKREHVPALIALLDSDDACGSVALAVSSYLGGRSTIGNEAAYLILGYRRGVYPPELNSNRDPIDKAEIRAWWIDAQKQQ
jgi:hypothetical protein